MKTILVILGLILSAQPAFAEDTTIISPANEFLEYCQEAQTFDGNPDANFWNVGMCVGFVMGARHALALWEEAAGDPKVCVPNDVPMEQTIRMFVKLMEEHPELLHQEAIVVLFVSLFQAYPCAGASLDS